MAKAEITTPQGVRIKLEGTSDEIAQVLDKLDKKVSSADRPRQIKSSSPRKSGRVLLVDHIASLIDSDFFKKPRGLAEIKAALEEMGHHYPVTTLSPVMLRQVRKKFLRRIREDKLWTYVR
jgi:hypothetical protein